MNEIIVERTAVTLSFACNLKCALCGVYAPYYKKPRRFSLEYLKETMKRYFDVVTYVKFLTLAGGEPMLYTDLPEIIDYLLQFKEQIGRIEIITNGTIVPNQATIDAAKKFGDKFYFLVDNYGPDKSLKIKEIDELLINSGIIHQVRNYTKNGTHCGGWIDYGDLTKKRRTHKEAEELFSKCAQAQKLKFPFCLVEGKMYPCSPYRRCNELEIIEDNYSEYIDLFDDKLTVEEQRQKIQSIYDATSLTACAYCDGMCEDSKRYFPAEQLTIHEESSVDAGARIYAEVLKNIKR